MVAPSYGDLGDRTASLLALRNYGAQQRQQVPSPITYSPDHHLFKGKGACTQSCTSSLEEASPSRFLIMVYDWEGKREICFQMYIKEKKALEEIMEFMRNTYQFAPR